MGGVAVGEESNDVTLLFAQSARGGQDAVDKAAAVDRVGADGLLAHEHAAANPTLGQIVGGLDIFVVEERPQELFAPEQRGALSPAAPRVAVTVRSVARGAERA